MVRNKIAAVTAEYIQLAAKSIKMLKVVPAMTVSFNSMMQRVADGETILRNHLVTKDDIFKQIVSEIDALAKWSSANSENIESFLSGVRSILSGFKVSEQDYWTDVTIRRLTSGAYNTAATSYNNQ